MEMIWTEWTGEFRRLLPGSADEYGGSGGFVPGEQFLGAAVPLRSGGGGGPVPALADGGRYRLTAERNAPIRFGDYVCRVSDGAVFRIVGEVTRTPGSAGIGMAAAEAERMRNAEGVLEDGSPDGDGESSGSGASGSPEGEREDDA